MVDISSGIEYPTVGFLSVVNLILVHRVLYTPVYVFQQKIFAKLFDTERPTDSMLSKLQHFRDYITNIQSEPSN